MKITILPRGTLGRFFDRRKEVEAEVPQSATASEALLYVGFDWKNCPSFGFFAVNGMKCMPDKVLEEGDQLKIYSKVYGG